MSANTARINSIRKDRVKKEITIIKLGIITVLAIIFVSFAFHIKAVAKENYFAGVDNNTEISYRTSVKDVLKAAGIKNSGITMTKQSNDGINIVYSVNIHMPEYIKLNKMEKEKLLADLYAIELDVMNSSVSFSFS